MLFNHLNTAYVIDTDIHLDIVWFLYGTVSILEVFEVFYYPISSVYMTLLMIVIMIVTIKN